MRGRSRSLLDGLQDSAVSTQLVCVAHANLSQQWPERRQHGGTGSAEEIQRRAFREARGYPCWYHADSDLRSIQLALPPQELIRRLLVPGKTNLVVCVLRIATQ